MQPADVEEIVTAYGAVLAEPTALGVREVRSLPYSKNEIKTALKIALSVTADADMRDGLKVAYVTLADFQPLTEREIRALQLWNDALNSSAAGDFDIAALAKTLGAEGKVVTAVQNRVADEANSLEQELKSGGF